MDAYLTTITSDAGLLNDYDQVIKNVLSYHIARGRVKIYNETTRNYMPYIPLSTFAQDQDNQSLSLTLEISNSNAQHVHVVGVGSTSDVIDGPYENCRITLHVIDQVLLPEPTVKENQGEKEEGQQEFEGISELLSSLSQESGVAQPYQEQQASGLGVSQEGLQQQDFVQDQQQRQLQYQALRYYLQVQQSILELQQNLSSASQIGENDNAIVYSQPSTDDQVADYQTNSPLFYQQYASEAYNIPYTEERTSFNFDNMESNGVTPQCSTVMDVLNSKPELQLWASALSKSNYSHLFRSEDIQLTMFAPVDASLHPLFDNEQTDVQSRIVDMLLGRHVVLGEYHTVQLLIEYRDRKRWFGWNASYDASFVQTEEFKGLLTIHGDDYSAVVVDGDIEACGSVVHVVEGLLFDVQELAYIK
eukprot:TRINITY_DN8458_c0_g2_i5.p1 TRINITY_DN8458_c0_g2~~TRINITY_DN8458_c0_g2_i5.p1  ORF type:complete len:468 (+),score=60.41 TRINITY_DN8458_c0_g2_i5:151-1404(+)